MLNLNNVVNYHCGVQFQIKIRNILRRCCMQFNDSSGIRPSTNCFQVDMSLRTMEQTWVSSFASSRIVHVANGNQTEVADITASSLINCYKSTECLNGVHAQNCLKRLDRCLKRLKLARLSVSGLSRLWVPTDNKSTEQNNQISVRMHTGDDGWLFGRVEELYYIS